MEAGNSLAVFGPAALSAWMRRFQCCNGQQTDDHSSTSRLSCRPMRAVWIDDHGACFSEVGRVLPKDGIFAFATLGPDSLSELREAWQSVDDDRHVNVYPDMHDIGDALVRAGLRDPVLDVDHLNVTYRDTSALYRDLTGVGARNCLRGRRQTLTGKSRFKAMNDSLAARMTDNVLSLELELVYGHAWGGGPRLPDGEFRVDPATIAHRSRAR
jgi:malonyl-CoA O-methyltransferase